MISKQTITDLYTQQLNIRCPNFWEICNFSYPRKQGYLYYRVEFYELISEYMDEFLAKKIIQLKNGVVIVALNTKININCETDSDEFRLEINGEGKQSFWDDDYGANWWLSK